MKTQIRISIIVAILLAQNSVLAATEYHCSAGCLFVNTTEKMLSYLGSVKGVSEYSDSNAYELLIRKCESLVQVKGLVGSPYLVKGYGLKKIHTESSSGSSSSQKNIDLSFKRGWFKTSLKYNHSESNSSSMSFFSNDEFEYSVQLALQHDPEVCLETKFSKEINLNTKEWIAGIYFLKITDKSSLSIYTKIVK